MMMRPSSLWRNLRRRDRVERDLDDELRATVDALTAEKIEQGMDVQAARRAAILELGGVESVKEQVRAARSGALVQTFIQDLRYAARLLRRNPLFTLTAALSLAIGIGATTTIFTIANGLLLRAAPGVADPDRLIDIVRAENGRPTLGEPMIPYREYVDIREATTTLSAVYGYELNLHPVGLAGPNGAERVFANIVTSNYFAALGVRAAAGRFFDARDSDREGASPFVVLSHGFWTRRFDADPGVVGRTMQINGQSLIVSGVAAEGFRGMSVVTPDIWVPAAMSQVIQPGSYGLMSRGPTLQLAIGGRLRPGASIEQAATDLDLIAQAIARQYPGELGAAPPAPMPGTREFSRRAAGGLGVVRSTPIPGSLRVLVAGFLVLLMTLVSLLLVIACSNVAGVLLARATTRRREMAVRTAVGAARLRLVRQLLTETLLLFTLGGVTGIALARVMTPLLMLLLPAFPLPAHVSVPLDARVVAFSLGLSLLAAVLSGIAPALHAARTDVATALKDEVQGPSDRLRLRSAFVVVQVAFSVLLVVAAGLFGRELQKASRIDWGFDARRVEAVSLDLSMTGYTTASGPDFARMLLDRIRAIPGIEAASIADRLPEPLFRINGAIALPGMASAGQSLAANWNSVEDGYFAALRMPLIAGRDFTEADGAGSQRVAIVDEAAARRLWPGASPIGQVLESAGMFGQLISRYGAAAPPQPHETLVVIGVVRSLNYGASSHDTQAPYVVYVPLRQRYGPQITVLARASGEGRVASRIRAVVASMNASLPIVDARGLDERADPVEQQLKISATVAGTVGLIGLLLASMGVYGVTAYAVAQRTREIGVRLSLGARPMDIVRAVMSGSLTLVAIGAAIGLVLSLGAGVILARSSLALSSFDPVIYGGTAILFMIVGGIACYVPVWRAIRVGALDALRYE